MSHVRTSFVNKHFLAQLACAIGVVPLVGNRLTGMDGGSNLTGSSTEVEVNIIGLEYLGLVGMVHFLLMRLKILSRVT